jgi:AcrR family transcriptional regulator
VYTSVYKHQAAACACRAKEGAVPGDGEQAGPGDGEQEGRGDGPTGDARVAGAAPRPRGRDACVAAIVGAASLLFAERGPAAVSLREVAAAANVNLGLIHRHVGSKDDLLAAVLRARPGVDEADVDAYEDPARLIVDLATQREPRPLQLLVIVRALLDGYDLASLGVDLPYLRRGAELVAERLGPTDARVRSALGAAVVLGWHTVGDAYLRLLGGGEIAPDELAASLRPAIEAMMAAPGALSGTTTGTTTGTSTGASPGAITATAAGAATGSRVGVRGAVIAYVPDLLDRSRLLAAARATGVEIDLVRTPGELVTRAARHGESVRAAPDDVTPDSVGLVVADLSRPGILDALGSLPGCETIGFASHVDRELMRAAREAGCRRVLARSAFFARLGELLAPA